jgi:hypothetical protein
MGPLPVVDRIHTGSAHLEAGEQMKRQLLVTIPVDYSMTAEGCAKLGVTYCLVSVTFLFLTYNNFSLFTLRYLECIVLSIFGGSLIIGPITTAAEYIRRAVLKRIFPYDGVPSVIAVTFLTLVFYVAEIWLTFDAVVFVVTNWT